MPYSLINKLNALMQHELPPQLRKGIPPHLEKVHGLNDNTYEAIDEIADAARSLFGPRLEPTHRQQVIMTEAGFPIQKGEHTLSVWKTGEIHTPKGIITYR